jgi:hypothetical protein
MRSVCVLSHFAGNTGSNESQPFPIPLAPLPFYRQQTVKLLSMLPVVKTNVEKKCKFPVINLPRDDVIAST